MSHHQNARTMTRAVPTGRLGSTPSAPPSIIDRVHSASSRPASEGCPPTAGTAVNFGVPHLHSGTGHSAQCHASDGLPAEAQIAEFGAGAGQRVALSSPKLRALSVAIR